VNVRVHAGGLQRHVDGCHRLAAVRSRRPYPARTAAASRSFRTGRPFTETRTWSREERVTEGYARAPATSTAVDAALSLRRLPSLSISTLAAISVERLAVSRSYTPSSASVIPDPGVDSVRDPS